eukprot:739801_1
MTSVASYTVNIDKATLDEKVGIALRTDEAGTRIAKLRPNTPASTSLLKEGDRIVSINGKSTEDLSAKQTADILRKTSAGTIEIVAEGQEFEDDISALPTPPATSEVSKLSEPTVEVSAVEAESTSMMTGILNAINCCGGGSEASKAGVLD